jgi:hypothetical protein
MHGPTCTFWASLTPCSLKNHQGAELVGRVRQTCEGCQLKIPSFGLPAEAKKRRWCGGCAPEGSVNISKLERKWTCEECGLKEPSFAVPPE